MSARLTREFGIGDSGTDVSLAQRLLGRDARRAHGVCDRETTEALRAWQISRGLTPSGFFGASSRAQMAMEEERWRELGGGALLERLSREEEARARDASERANERAGGSGRTRGVVATSTTPREAPRVSRVARGALVLVVASAALGAAAHLRNRERFAAFVDSATAWTRESRAKVALDVAREFVGACGARARARWTEIAADFAERRRALVRAAATAISRVRSAAERVATNDALDAGAPLAEGHFDENGRWWESPLPASTPKAADARPRPAEPSPRGGASTARERAEQMRERWVNIRRQQVDVGADERRAIERVSKFLRDAE
uniref:Peptidoglycan binding-like domain-containing protein n=1 Tax=Ostreococcus sp. 'lucimarinus' TaxID=242159 RepID=A0A7R9T651_9CHLO